MNEVKYIRGDSGQGDTISAGSFMLEDVNSVKSEEMSEVKHLVHRILCHM